MGVSQVQISRLVNRGNDPSMGSNKVSGAATATTLEEGGSSWR